MVSQIVDQQQFFWVTVAFLLPSECLCSDGDGVVVQNNNNHVLQSVYYQEMENRESSGNLIIMEKPGILREYLEHSEKKISTEKKGKTLGRLNKK